MDILKILKHVEGKLSTIAISFLLVGLQAMMDVQFSCPCRVEWNFLISVFIFFVPTIFALAIMLLLLRPCTYKCSRSQEQNNSGRSQGQENSGTSQAQENLSCNRTFSVCLIPCLVWICIYFIDGDYFACGLTTWNGYYACDKELHPNCLNWCKPNKLIQREKESKYYEDTRNWIAVSKTIGYVLAAIFCTVAIIFVSFDCCKGGVSACCRSTDPERQSPAGSGNEQGNDIEMANVNPSA